MVLERKVFWVIWVFAVVGMFSSAYTVFLHYKPVNVDSAIPCDFSDKFSCSTVNKSSYSVFLGIPVSIIGFFGYLFLFLLPFYKSPGRGPLLFYVSGLGLVFSLYLTYVELFILKAICLFCIVSQISILTIFVFSAIKYGKHSLRIEFE